jgi:hypothetical protein
MVASTSLLRWRKLVTNTHQDRWNIAPNNVMPVAHRGADEHRVTIGRRDGDAVRWRKILTLVLIRSARVEAPGRSILVSRAITTTPSLPITLSLHGGTPVWCRLGIYLPSAIRAWCPPTTEGHPGAHGGRGWAVCGAERLLCQLILRYQLHGHWRYVCRHMRTMGKRQIRGS